MTESDPKRLFSGNQSEWHHRDARDRFTNCSSAPKDRPNQKFARAFAAFERVDLDGDHLSRQYANQYEGRLKTGEDD